MRAKTIRWLVSFVATLPLFQTLNCALQDPEAVEALNDRVFAPQIANLISDTLFFILDNLFVRISG